MKTQRDILSESDVEYEQRDRAASCWEGDAVHKMGLVLGVVAEQ